MLRVDEFRTYRRMVDVLVQVRGMATHVSDGFRRGKTGEVGVEMRTTEFKIW